MYFFLDKKPPKEWPDKGQIVFKKFNLRYSLDEAYVIRNLNIQIQAMEKVMIIMYHFFFNIILITYS